MQIESELLRTWKVLRLYQELYPSLFTPADTPPQVQTQGQTQIQQIQQILKRVATFELTLSKPPEPSTSTQTVRTASKGAEVAVTRAAVPAELLQAAERIRSLASVAMETTAEEQHGELKRVEERGKQVAKLKEILKRTDDDIRFSSLADLRERLVDKKKESRMEDLLDFLVGRTEQFTIGID